MPDEKLNHDWTHPSPTVVATYEVYLRVEEELMRQKTSILTETEPKDLEKKLVNIRILGCLSMFGPMDTACGHVAKTILNDKSKRSGALINRGAFYD